MTFTSSFPEPWRRIHRIARRYLIILCILAVGYFVFIILFPSQSLSFDFKNPGASKNTLLYPHDSNNISLAKGNLSEKSQLITDAPIESGDYSIATVTLTPDTNTPPRQGDALLQKSYRAFFLPEGEPVVNPNPLPNGLHSGSLLSFADGVFLIDGSSIRPIGDATIFQNLGYRWEDVLPASEEDMGLYEKGKMVLLGNQHPDGTIFYSIDTHTYFLIQNNAKHRIQNEEVAQSYLYNTHPILVSETGLNLTQSCLFTLSGILTDTYGCTIPLNAFHSLSGDSYRLTAQFDGAISFQNARMVFSHTIDVKNMKQSLSSIKQRIFAHYGYEK